MVGKAARPSFASDNVAPTAPEILQALVAANQGVEDSYGADRHTRRLTALARELFETELAIFPVATGTAANALALATLVPPYGAIYCHDAAHIMTDECGAPEFHTGGAKLIGLPTPDGKLRPGQLAAPLGYAAEMGVHHVRPAAISVTQVTEWGTVYCPDEVAALAEVARAHGLRLHMDGARFANAVAHLGCSPAEASWRAGIDVLSLGATKNGAMAAEAVLFFDPALAAGFESRRKRAGHLWSKQRFLSSQLVAYLEDGLWLRHAAHANAMATRLALGLQRIPGFGLAQPVEANEVFATLPAPAVARLEAEGFGFHRWTTPGIEGTVIRLVTSFATTAREVDELLAAAGETARG
jgi:threonine aldolase